MIDAFDQISEKYLQGQISQNDLISFASFKAYEEALGRQGNRLNKDKALPEGISKHMLIAVRSYNSYGSSEKRANLDAKKLIVVRMQIKNIRSEVQAGMNIGSVIFCQSFFLVEPQTAICLTKGVPNSLVWLTDNMHYRNTPLPLEVDKPLNCEQLGQM